MDRTDIKMEATILHHIVIVLCVLWILSTFNFTHPVLFFISLIYLYLVHERYVMRLRRNLKFEEKRSSFQRRVLSDSETIRWLNYAVEKIWPICMEEIVSQKVLLPIVPWFLEKYKPWTVKEAVVQQLYMGRSPPILTEMRVVPQSTGDDHLVMELGLSFRTAEDMGAILAVKLTKRLGFGMWAKLHLTGMHVEGKVLVGVKFLRHWPFLGRLRVCFVEPPYFQMTVKPIFQHGLDVTELPGIAGWLDKLLAVAFEQTLVEPNMLVVDMEKFVSPQQEPWFSVEEKDPIAYAIVEVIDAADLKSADLNGLSDPYVKGQLGPYRFRTKTQKKTLFPKWHEEFKVPICSWESPNELDIEVGDKDRFVDDMLGNCSVSISDLRDGQRHDMWLSLKNVKTGRIHLAITVIEGNRRVSDEKRYGEMLNTGDDKSPNEDETSQRGSISSGPSQKSPKVADEFEPIEIEGQKETGIWVHHPGSEVTQIWEPRKGKNRLVDSQILVEGSFKSSVSGNNNDSSSTDESQESNKGNEPNKVVRGLKKFGSLFHRKSSKKLDTACGIGDSIPSPHANIRAVNERDIGIKLIVDDPDIALPSPLDVPKYENKDRTERENSQSPGEKVKDKAKSVLNHAGKSADKIKHTFSGKGSKKLQSDSNSVETVLVSSEGSVMSSASTAGVEGLHAASKPKSISGSDSPQSELNGHVAISEPALNAEDLKVVVNHQGNQKISNDPTMNNESSVKQIVTEDAKRE